MAKQWSVQCDVCEKKNSFSDSQDISQARWTVLAWLVPSGEPLVICDKCEYGLPKKKNKVK